MPLFPFGASWASDGEDESNKEILTISEGRFLLSRSETPPDFSSTESQPVTLPDIWEKSRYEGGNSGWYRFLVEKKIPPEGVWGVYLPNLNMNAAVYFKDHFLGDGGSFEKPLGRNWNRPLLFAISPELWRPGVNTLFVRLAGYPLEIKLSPIQVGPLPHRKAYTTSGAFSKTRLFPSFFP